MPNQKKNQNKRTRAYVEEVFRQIEQKPDVTDIMILNNKGNPVKTTMESSLAIQYAGLYEILRDKVCMGLQKMDARNELIMLRLRTTKNETLIVPDGKITIVVTQNAKDGFQNA
ncbi:dynein light chain roadblock-type 2-like [Lucilia sericata]|uniref:dynein light chain roadblock-type 2-like n=2 Tax=Lucilia sericata TaxID=13632 RepID=UPI0018A833A8|nr:dynein light chain roadblock-type 2-like [Lucilia sericata]XP_037827083.1 dynein light chain roadblock-type 2-like [Lucilia sericata]